MHQIIGYMGHSSSECSRLIGGDADPLSRSRESAFAKSWVTGVDEI
jgi:hypothetical protein